MGHTETFQFIDPREGEYGVAYCAATEDELRIIAKLQGYSGKFTPIITAYPPRPIGRQTDSISLDVNGEIPF